MLSLNPENSHCHSTNFFLTLLVTDWDLPLSVTFVQLQKQARNLSVTHRFSFLHVYGTILRDSEIEAVFHGALQSLAKEHFGCLYDRFHRSTQGEGLSNALASFDRN